MCSEYVRNLSEQERSFLISKCLERCRAYPPGMLKRSAEIKTRRRNNCQLLSRDRVNQLVVCSNPFFPLTANVIW